MKKVEPGSIIWRRSLVRRNWGGGGPERPISPLQDGDISKNCLLVRWEGRTPGGEGRGRDQPNGLWKELILNHPFRGGYGKTCLNVRHYDSGSLMCARTLVD